MKALNCWLLLQCNFSVGKNTLFVNYLEIKWYFSWAQSQIQTWKIRIRPVIVPIISGLMKIHRTGFSEHIVWAVRALACVETHNTHFSRTLTMLGQSTISSIRHLLICLIITSEISHSIFLFKKKTKPKNNSIKYKIGHNLGKLHPVELTNPAKGLLVTPHEGCSVCAARH